MNKDDVRFSSEELLGLLIIETPQLPNTTLTTNLTHYWPPILGPKVSFSTLCTFIGPSVTPDCDCDLHSKAFFMLHNNNKEKNNRDRLLAVCTQSLGSFQGPA